MPTIGKSGDEGRYLFSESVEIWGPLVEGFLEEHGLPWQDLDPSNTQKLVKLPDNFPSDMKAGFFEVAEAGAQQGIRDRAKRGLVLFERTQDVEDRAG